MIVDIDKNLDAVNPNQLDSEIRRIYDGKFAVYINSDTKKYYIDINKDPDSSQLDAINLAISQHVPMLIVPASVTIAQLRIALRRKHGVSAGQLSSIMNSIIASITDPDSKADAADLWHYATTIERAHPLVEVIGAAFGFSDREIDELFVFANTI